MLKPRIDPPAVSFEELLSAFRQALVQAKKRPAKPKEIGAAGAKGAGAAEEIQDV